MESQFSRTELLIGKENIEKLHKAKVAIFGIGGVGTFVCETLVRAGIENFILVDNDKIDITNINRQIIAMHSTIGKFKTHTMKKRMLDINPNAKIVTYEEFFNSNTTWILDDSVDYVVDTIDTVSSKIELIKMAKELNINIISSMGTGNKLEPDKFEITDINKTSVCPLAKVIRKELRKRNIEKVNVLYSKEEPKKIIKEYEKNITSSISFVPSSAGILIASKVIKDIIEV